MGESAPHAAPFVRGLSAPLSPQSRLGSVSYFTEFVKAFSHLGSEMVDLAVLTGDHPHEDKYERRRAQMAAARRVLDRSTLMLMTSSKVR